jgi:hypothetical protein
MKNITRSLLLAVIAMSSVLFAQCTKKKDTNTINPTGEGKITFNSNTYKLKCEYDNYTLNTSPIAQVRTAGLIGITTSTSDSIGIMITDIPTASSGTTSFATANSLYDATYSIDAGVVNYTHTPAVYVIVKNNTTFDVLMSNGGSVTKTGERSFTFTVQLHHGDGSPTSISTITGSGTY